MKRTALKTENCRNCGDLSRADRQRGCPGRFFVNIAAIDHVRATAIYHAVQHVRGLHHKPWNFGGLVLRRFAPSFTFFLLFNCQATYASAKQVHISVAFDAPEALLRREQTGSGPTLDHVSVVPIFHVASM